jgi:hypothetical protein
MRFFGRSIAEFRPAVCAQGFAQAYPQFGAVLTVAGPVINRGTSQNHMAINVFTAPM